MSEASREPEPLLGSVDALIGLLGQVHGRDVSAFDPGFLARCLERRQNAAGMPNTAAYLERLRNHPAEAESFVASLQIGYSEFFRNPLTFAVMEQVVLPRLLDRVGADRSELRIWSAGCSTGEEAYSVAILLDELVAVRGRAVPCHIFATDTCAAGLVTARAGVYQSPSVQNLRQKHLDAYFTRAGHVYVIHPRLQDQVDFSVHDLLDPGTTCPPASIFGDFDLVLCCNLLFYYGPEFRQRIIEKLLFCLGPSGFLVTGETERAMVEQTCGFHAVAPPAAVFQKG
jgi:chemotaxis protein methyltransferase CheR